MPEFKPIYKPNQLTLGTGSVAIATGWTEKKAIAKRLQDHEYAVIGNLYSSKRGLNFLVRNLLANPHVRGIVILDATKEDRNSGSCQCLRDFFCYGVEKGKSEDTGRECWVVRSEIAGYLDEEIPLEAIDLLRSSLVVYGASSVDEVRPHVENFNELFEFIEPYSEPMIFPYIEPVATIQPGPLYGHRIEGRTIAETWVKILHEIRNTGISRPTGYDGFWQELISLTAVVTDEPEGFYFPEPNYLPCDRSFIENYLGQILDDAPYAEGVKYTYGQRGRSWFGQDQYDRCVEKLIDDPNSASAVVIYFDPGSGAPSIDSPAIRKAPALTPEQIERVRSLSYGDTLLSEDKISTQSIARPGRKPGDSDHDHGGSPCLNHVWFRIVDDALCLTALFRSNDMFAAWPSNAMGLRALQLHVKGEIERRTGKALKVGPLLTTSLSAHIYDDCWENVDRLLATRYESIARESIARYNDPVGSFTIDVSDGEILVTRITPGSGEVVGTYRGKKPLELIRRIAIDCPAIGPAHIGYLGIELERARQMMADYVQDRK